MKTLNKLKIRFNPNLIDNLSIPSNEVIDYTIIYGYNFIPENKI